MKSGSCLCGINRRVLLSGLAILPASCGLPFPAKAHSTKSLRSSPLRGSKSRETISQVRR
jgi:hypothetical protein